MSEHGGMNIRRAIAAAVQGKSLSRVESAEVMTAMMNGETTDAQIAAWITALRMKGETIDEITGLAFAMRSKSEKVRAQSAVSESLLDTCGTGGDGLHTFNISTASAIVAAAAGVRIAKHGNRAISSKSGSADVLEALGVQLQLTPGEAERCLEEVGLCFMFAPLYHGSTRHAAAARREIGIRTVFNLLGPLTNPAGADRQLIGVYDKNLTNLVCHVVRELGLKRALVVCSEDGMDEISVCGLTYVSELRDGEIVDYTLDPQSLGVALAAPSQLSGGDAAFNAKLIRAIFAGEQGANRDIVLLNSGAALYLADRAVSIADGVKLAAETMDSGRATSKLEQLAEVTTRLIAARTE